MSHHDFSKQREKGYTTSQRHNAEYNSPCELRDRVRDLMGLLIADGITDMMRMTVLREKYGIDRWEMLVRIYPNNASDEEERSSLAVDG